jgi:hypothetical protein
MLRRLGERVRLPADRQSDAGKSARGVRARTVALVAVTLAAGVVIAGGSAGTTTKPYTAVFSNSVAGGATNADVTLTLHNLSASQSLGSANVTAASNGSGAFTITGETGASVAATQTYPASVLMLRNLGLVPGGSLTVHISVNTPCASGSYTWGIRAKQSNDFNGNPGNDFTLQPGASNLATAISSNSCRLKFVTQPASATINTVITDSAYNPTVTGGPGSPHYISVQAVDSSGVPITSATGTVTLSKVAGSGGSFSAADTTASFNAGIATFPSLESSAEGTGLQLKASASGFADSDPSSPTFDITPGGANCAGVLICSFTTTLTNSQVDTTGTGDFNFIAIGNAVTVPAAVTAPGGGCDYFVGTGTGFNETDSRNGDGSLDFTYYIKVTALKKAYGPNYGQPDVPLCAGGKVVVNNHPVDCDPATQSPWHGRHLGTDGRFDGTYRTAVCGTDGYWWGILGTRQDPNPPINPASDPTITNWGSSADGLSRTFTIHVPAGWDWRTN